MRHSYVQPMEGRGEESGSGSWRGPDSCAGFVIIWIALLQDLHCSFATYDIDGPATGIVKYVITITDRG